MPARLLKRAREITYSGGAVASDKQTQSESAIIPVTPRDLAQAAQKIDEPEIIPRSKRFGIGDSVTVYPKKEIGIIYACADEKGRVGVQIKGRKQLINHKRLKLKIPASELYPDDYDLAIVFDSVENRKARHLMGRKHVEGTVAVIKEGNDEKEKNNKNFKKDY